jgi:PAS domain S-box-containing protein
MLKGFSIRGKIAVILCSLIMLVFVNVQAMVVFKIIESSYGISSFAFLCVMVFIPPFFMIVSDVINYNKKQKNKTDSIELMLNESALISRADKQGKITFVNDKFCYVSGYKRQELLGQDHSMLNSRTHPKDFWVNMYKTVVTYKSIWNEVVINKNKKGEEYVVNSWIKGEFDETGKFIGFISVRQDITEIYKQKLDIEKKNSYLEHAAKILRHDMHSGINTYIPRGLSSLKRRLKEDKIKELKIESPLKLLEEGLSHAQKVYNGVKEFTNLVKKDSKLNKTNCDLGEILKSYLKSTAYSSQVNIDDLMVKEVNESLFCTAIDNLIRNGLKYNDSKSKMVHIYKEDENTIVVQDNGRGMSKEDFEEYSKPYTRKEGQKESGTGLGLNITIAIIKEHGFTISSKKLEECGTEIKIRL